MSRLKKIQLNLDSIFSVDRFTVHNIDKLGIAYMTDNKYNLRLFLQPQTLLNFKNINSLHSRVHYS